MANTLLVLANDLDRPDRKEVLRIAAQEIDLMADRLPNRDAPADPSRPPSAGKRTNPGG